jgi:hypothetical protein
MSPNLKSWSLAAHLLLKTSTTNVADKIYKLSTITSNVYAFLISSITLTQTEIIMKTCLFKNKLHPKYFFKIFLAIGIVF